MLLVEQVLRMYETSNKVGMEEKLIAKSPHGKGALKEKEPSKHRITYCVQVTLIGVLLHCISDGFAFGVSGYIQESSFNYKVFFALTLNKGPEIFSVSTFLLHENYKKSTVHKNILALSTITPILGFLTYITPSLFFSEMSMGESNYPAAAISLLITSGAFLYVATLHVLPEVYCSGHVHKPSSHPHLPEEHVHDESHSSKTIELLLLIAGFLTPLLLNYFIPKESL
eukprot:TRINITY_DN8809_c0_g1_i26.p1 TRINITY_DN8809_c0_g1~~TRINITY_DN8809_c0_g1_i26.p1  ORF type:complete len:227 (-),score=41.08 TRINITY_DN8809_c0_g1_i26:165-845(-)